MNYFKQTIKFYIMLALKKAGANIDDTDTHAELDQAMADLDAHIKATIDQRIKLHLVTLAQTMATQKPAPSIPGQQHSMPDFSTLGLATPEPSDRERLERGDRDVPCAECQATVDPGQEWQPGIHGEVYCAKCTTS